MRLMNGDRVQHWLYGNGTVFDNSWQYDEVYVRFDKSIEGIKVRSVQNDSLQRLC
jgi:hypothetical protein